MGRKTNNMKDDFKAWCTIDQQLYSLGQSLKAAGVSSAGDTIVDMRHSLARLMESVQDDIYAELTF